MAAAVLRHLGGRGADKPAIPFLKWAGGKRQLLPHLMEAVNRLDGFKTYHEPFIGGGALYFEMCAARRLQKARLADINDRLIQTYLAVRDDVENLIAVLREHEQHHCETHYYQVRANIPQSPTERAARIIYLNKTCFNGLFRENSRGEFNVPMGRYTNPRICDAANLRACSKTLQAARIETASFETILSKAKPGDFVYFDPPYMPLTRTASFTAYHASGFGEDAQRELARVFACLDAKNVRVLLSNSDTPLLRALYRDYAIKQVIASRQVNSNPEKRSGVPELLVSNF